MAKLPFSAPAPGIDSAKGRFSYYMLIATFNCIDLLTDVSERSY